MSHVLVMSLPPAVGLALALLAGRRSWAPPLWVALAAGLALRVAMLALAVQDTWQPYDLVEDFRSAADTVLDGRDPVTYLRSGGWHFLPFMAYVLAGERAVGEALGVPWEIMGRLGPMAADLALIPVVARLAPRHRELRAFQYACVPMAFLVSTLHGQLVPYTLLFGLAGLLAARRDRAHLAGLLLGLSVSSTSWSVLMLPGVLVALSGARHRLIALGWTAALPAAFLLSSTVVLDTPLRELPDTAKAIMDTRPLVGDWGWTAVVLRGELTESATYGHIGTPILLLGLLAAGWWWRRADPADLTLALLLAFLVLTYRFGPQYLAWPVPLLLARPTRYGWPAMIVGTLWAAAGYFYLTRLDEPTWWHAHNPWALSSLAVIPLLVLAMPWARRRPPVPPARTRWETVTPSTKISQ